MRRSVARKRATVETVAPISRNLVPKPSLGIVPAVISDQSCFAAVGLTGDQLRHVVKVHGIPCRKVGARLLVAVEDLVLFVRSVDAIDPASPAPASAGAVPELDTVDAVLAALGRRRTA